MRRRDKGYDGEEGGWMLAKTRECVPKATGAAEEIKR